MTGPQLHELDDSLPGISLSLNPSEDYEPSSTLQYVNSQLVAHGFARAPGLSIDGISNEDGQKLVKCLMAMLSQRMVYSSSLYYHKRKLANGSTLFLGGCWSN